MGKFSGAALVVGTAFIFLTGFFGYPKWKQSGTEATISWDVSGYYLYLPAVFIYKDLKQCRFVDTVLQRYHPTPDFQQAFRHESGNFVMKYTMGQAIMFAPFFLLSHVFALLTSYPADGFSLPYQFGISVGMMLYAFIGLWFLRKILLRFFSDIAVAFVILTIVFATNYLNYTAIDGAMTHNTLFLLYSLFLYCLIRYTEEQHVKWSISCGLLAGLLVLVRPTELVCLVIPLFWNITSFDGLKQRASNLCRHPAKMLMATLAFLVVVAAQLAYWKWSSGNWIVDGYRSEGFSWLHPHFVQGLFSYKAGWFVYTPAMLLIIPGFVLVYRDARGLFLPFFIFSIIFLYICFCWREWWYGASLGQRAIIQAYPVFAFALAAFFEAVRKKRIIGFLTLLFLLACTFYNLWLTYQAHRGGLFRGGEMTGSYFWRVLGRFHVPDNVRVLLDNEEQLPKSMLNAFVYLRADPTDISDTLDQKRQYSKQVGLEVPKSVSWIRVNLSAHTPIKEWDVWKMPQAMLVFYRSGQIVKANFLRISRILGDGETGVISFDAKVPPSFDRAVFSVWNAGTEKPLYIKSVAFLGFSDKLVK